MLQLHHNLTVLVLTNPYLINIDLDTDDSTGSETLDFE